MPWRDPPVRAMPAASILVPTCLQGPPCCNDFRPALAIVRNLGSVPQEKLAKTTDLMLQAFFPQTSVGGASEDALWALTPSVPCPAAMAAAAVAYPLQWGRPEIIFSDSPHQAVRFRPTFAQIHARRNTLSRRQCWSTLARRCRPSRAMVPGQVGTVHGQASTSQNSPP